MTVKWNKMMMIMAYVDENFDDSDNDIVMTAVIYC